MFTSVGIPVVGLVENMTSFSCKNCGHEENIFGGGGKKDKSRGLATELGVPFMGGVPLEPQIMLTSDEGTPIVIKFPDSKSTKSYVQLSNKLLSFLVG